MVSRQKYKVYLRTFFHFRGNSRKNTLFPVRSPAKFSMNLPCNVYVPALEPKLLLFVLKGFVAAHTLPVMYERYEDQVDGFIHQVGQKLQHHYRKVDTGFLSKIPKGKFIAKKFNWKFLRVGLGSIPRLYVNFHWVSSPELYAWGSQLLM